MAKTQEELNALKQEYETVINKLQELTEDELSQVAGGNPLEVLPIAIIELLYGGNRCEICEDQPHKYALKNHYMNKHGMSYEEAMAYVPPELRDKQW